MTLGWATAVEADRIGTRCCWKDLLFCLVAVG
jgi:hypothetical protein